MQNITNTYDPLDRMQTVVRLIRMARAAAQDAAAGELYGARQVRARELVQKLAEVQGHAERLAFVVNGDLRADKGDSR